MLGLLLFISIMGGIALFGILGMVVGPLIAAVFDTLIKTLDYRLHPRTAMEASIDIDE